MASSASGQDEPNRALWLATRCIPQAKFHQKPYNKSFIDQFCSVNMAGYWPRSFFPSFWTSTSSRSINTQKRTWPISSHVDRTKLVNNPYILLNKIQDWALKSKNEFCVSLLHRLIQDLSDHGSSKQWQDGKIVHCKYLSLSHTKP